MVCSSVIAGQHEDQKPTEAELPREVQVSNRNYILLILLLLLLLFFLLLLLLLLYNVSHLPGVQSAL